MHLVTLRADGDILPQAIMSLLTSAATRSGWGNHPLREIAEHAIHSRLHKNEPVQFPQRRDRLRQFIRAHGVGMHRELVRVRVFHERSDFAIRHTLARDDAGERRPSKGETDLLVW